MSTSCKKFLEIESPKASVEQSNIFTSDDMASSAMIGVYQAMSNNTYASGNLGSVTVLGGLSSDELIAYNSEAIIQFYDNQLNPQNTYLNSSLYGKLNMSIYTCNAIIEGLNAPNRLTRAVKMQLEGEAKFVRAFAYFYLINLFGAVPLQLVTDYRITQTASRSPIGEVYKQILADLISAEGLLADDYVTTERVRPNKSTVQALLARTYLFLEDWNNAEKYASVVIEKTGTYSLVNLDDVFIKNSKEAIWQIIPRISTNTNEGLTFILTATPTNSVSLDKNFAINGFELNDKRKISWIRSFTNNTGTYYYPFKYKVKSSSTVTEYSMVFRFAEQFLIRSEARAKNNKLLGAIDDLDVIRGRAGIALIKVSRPNISKEELLNVIYNERKVELFTEWGHRWLDLKRTNRANTVLMSLKPGWQSTDVLYPIPSNEINRNLNIVQNEGY